MQTATLLSNVQSICPDIDIRLIRQGCGERTISSLTFWADDLTAVSDTCLYIAKNAAALPPETEGVFLVTQPDFVPPPRAWVFYVSPADFESCVNILSDLLRQEQQHEAEFSKLLYLMLEHPTLQHLVDAIASFFDRSVIVTALSFRLMAKSDSVPITDPIWQDIIRSGYCTYEFIEVVNALMPPEMVNQPSNAYEVKCTQSKEKKLCNSLFRNQKHIGYLTILDNEKGLLPYHYEYLPQCSALIVKLLEGMPHFHSMSVEQIEDIFVNLLCGESPEVSVQRIQAAHIQLPEEMRCCIVCPKSETSHDMHYLQKCLSSLFPSGFFFVHDDHLIALLNKNAVPFFRSLDESLKSIIKQVGISSIFGNIRELSVHYVCALRACEISNRLNDGKTICEYDSYVFYDLLLSAPDPDLVKRNIHPSFETLHQYDLSHASNLLGTLMKYIEYGFNINQTAEVLYLHRNSLRNRLEKICELTGLIFDDQAILFRLECSLRINSLLHLYAT